MIRGNSIGDGFVRLEQLARPPAAPLAQRDPADRARYLELSLAEIPRILGAMDRNPFRSTYGCLDRAFWHYRTSDFPSQMYQEAVWPLALVYHHDLPGNRWQGNARLRELVIAALRFTASSSHGDGSCDDYYPFERALGAAAFATNAAAQAYLLLQLDDPLLRAWFDRRARWIARHVESGRLSNHQAVAAVALHRAGQITGRREHIEAARDRLGRVLSWQSEEGWFEEYGGADPGYQTVTLDCLAVYQRLTDACWLTGAIERGLAFARLFLHPDDSYAGEYGSRGTYHFYPHGCELLAHCNPDAADLADGFLASVARGRQAHFADDRMFAHRVGNLIESWLDWSPHRPPGRRQGESVDLPQARIYVRRGNSRCTIISAARGGTFKHFDGPRCLASDTGLFVELEDGRVAVSQPHDLGRDVWIAGTEGCLGSNDAQRAAAIEVRGPLYWARFETLASWRFIALRLFLLTVGRWCGTLVRRLLQHRLITGRRPALITLSRRFEFVCDGRGPRLRVLDTIELCDRRMCVRRLGFGADCETTYVAASGVYQDTVLHSWYELAEYVPELNRRRRVTIIREIA